MPTKEAILEDIQFARESAEFAGPYMMCPLLRYVVALNPEMTKAEFVEAAVEAGFNAKTAGTQFHASRKFDRENYSD